MPSRLDVMERGNALTVMRLLTSAFPTYPLPNDSLDLYVDELLRLGVRPATAAAAALEWTRHQDHFPRVSDLVEACQAQRRAEADQEAEAYRQGQLTRGEMSVCVDCDGSGMVLVDDTGHGTYRPCATCDPEMYGDWREGHLDADHNVFGCASEGCKKRAKSRGRRYT